MCSRLLCLLVLVNLNGGGALKIMFPMVIHQAGQLILFWEWQVTAVLSVAAGLAVYLHGYVDFGEKKKLDPLK